MKLRKPCLFDGEALDALKNLIPLAPLHQPHGLIGIKLTSEIYPQAKQIA